MFFLRPFLVCLSFLLVLNTNRAQELRQLAVVKPAAIVDLSNPATARLLQTKWFTQPAYINATTFKAPGPSRTDSNYLYPTGAVLNTQQLLPSVTDADFNTRFSPVDPASLTQRRGSGLVSFVWYKVDITIPKQIEKFNAIGSKVVFEIVVDDYSEIWVNGKQSKHFGQTGAGVNSGYNNRNRVVLTDNAKEGENFSIAILGINGPIGQIPDNYIWIRNAVVDFYPKQAKEISSLTAGKVFRIDEKLSAIIANDAIIEKVAEGFSFTEGPVWHPDGFLLFSDPNMNMIYSYSPIDHNVHVYMSHSGYKGTDIGEYGQPGSNGLVIDQQGRLVVNEHGNRRVVRHEIKGPVTILSDSYNQKRLNSPNDLVIKKDGTIYFTDPPYGLPDFFNDARKELNFSGIYMIKDQKTVLLSTDLGGPNGIAFSPDEKYLYVSNWDIRDIHHTKTLWRYELQSDGTLKNGKIFFDFSFTEDEEALDGVKVDKEGNIFVSAPGGIWVLSRDAKLLGKITMPERPANMAWGDEDGKTLYMTAHKSIYKIRVLTGGNFSWQ